MLDKKTVFLYYWNVITNADGSVVPEPVPEYRFAPPRRWRFDYAFLDSKVGIEVEGGVFVRGAHTRGSHYTSDLEKYNTATALGWRVFRFTPDMLEEEPVRWIQMVITATQEN